jgi:hypothetical protein
METAEEKAEREAAAVAAATDAVDVKAPREGGDDEDGGVGDDESSGAAKSGGSARVLLDDNFMEFTEGRPLPLHDRAKEYFNRAVLNDTKFLSWINVVDYSILVGMDERNNELVLGIIDYMRQYDIIKRMERMGKSVGMIAGQAEPTIIQPPAYRNRFQAAMQRYFMMVPDKWTPFHMQAVPVGHHHSRAQAPTPRLLAADHRPPPDLTTVHEEPAAAGDDAERAAPAPGGGGPGGAGGRLL